MKNITQSYFYVYTANYEGNLDDIFKHYRKFVIKKNKKIIKYGILLCLSRLITTMFVT